MGYIIGFPHDTEESVRADVETLTTDVRPHRASFFMLTPLPGSHDHKQMVEAGAEMSSDYNEFDSFYEAMPHPHLKDGAWTRLYRFAAPPPANNIGVYGLLFVKLGIGAGHNIQRTTDERRRDARIAWFLLYGAPA